VTEGQLLTVACVCAPLQFENFTLLWGTSQKASVDSHEVKREALNACKYQVRQSFYFSASSHSVVPVVQAPGTSRAGGAGTRAVFSAQL
jgi:hypothetical protein